VILLLAVAAGLLAGGVRARVGGRRLTSPHLRLAWMVPLAFLPQWLAFRLPATRELISDDLAAVALVSSQVLLLVFAWFNRAQPGIWTLGLGLALNLLVIVLNGGLMPISPRTVAYLVPEAPPNAWQIGGRLGTGKDVVLPIAATRLWWLSDWFRLPSRIPYRVAFSLGDVFVAVGAFRLLWTMGGKAKHGGQIHDTHGDLVSQRYIAVQRRTEQTGHCSSDQSKVLRSIADQPNDSVGIRVQRRVV
jgi:hypothetical protein